MKSTEFISQSSYSFRPSYKMRMSIARLERKYGKLNKTYGIEALPENRVGRGFYDYCELRCDILKNLGFIVNHEGEIFR